MLNLEIPKKLKPLIQQAHMVAENIVPTDLAQVRYSRAHLSEGARHAGCPHGRHAR